MATKIGLAFCKALHIGTITWSSLTHIWTVHTGYSGWVSYLHDPLGKGHLTDNLVTASH